jgi:hypothetical protein
MNRLSPDWGNGAVVDFAPPNAERPSPNSSGESLGRVGYQPIALGWRVARWCTPVCQRWPGCASGAGWAVTLGA